MSVIPLIPKVFNAVKRALFLPCNVPTGLYVELAFEAAIHMFTSFAAPDFRELYHQGRGNSLLCDLKGALLDSEHIPPPSESAATRFFFTSAEWFDLATWYTFLAALAANGLLLYSSQIQRYSGCKNRNNPNIGSGGWFFGAIHSDGTWGGNDYYGSAPGPFYPAWPATNVIVPPGKRWTLTESVSYHDFLGIPVATNHRIFNETTGVVLDSHSNLLVDDQLNGKTHVWYEGYNASGSQQLIRAQSQYLGPALPTGQAFPDHDSHAFVFVEP